MNNVLVKYGAASKYGAEIPMTTLGITMKVNQIITGIVIGIFVGSQPIIGYNYGAGKTDRAQKTYLLAIICSTLVMGVGTLVFQMFPDRIVSIFGSESELYQEFAVKSLRIFLLLILLNGFQLCTGTFFQAVGKPVQATLISLSRQVLFLLPALLILPHFFGVEGALLAGPVGDACAFVLALAFGLAEWRKRPGYPNNTILFLWRSILMTHLSDSITIRNLTLPNRLVMPPMATAKADENGYATHAVC